MYKKIFILLLIVSPFWYSLLIGFPALSAQKYHQLEKTATYAVTRRCFGVGNFTQFISCYSYSERLNGTNFIRTVIDKTNQISPLFTFLLCASFILFILLSIVLTLW